MNLQQYFNKYKDRNLFINNDESCTYGDCLVFIQKTLFFLKKNGLKKNSKILISAKNSITLAKFYLSFLANENEIFIIGENLTVNTKKQIIKENKFEMAIIDDKSQKDLIKNYCKIIIDINSPGLLRNIKEINNLHNLSKKLNLGKNILNIYTSGTTDQPKKVSHSLFNLLNNAQEFSKIVGINKENRFINFLPMNYLGGYYNLLLIPFFNGSSIFIDNVFSFKTLSNLKKNISDFKINTLWLTPSICRILLEKYSKNSEIKILKNNIRLALVGMDHVNSDLKEKFKEKFNLRLLENYGLSETLFISSENIKDKFFSSGKLLRSVKIKINNINKELIVKSPFISKNFSKKNFKTGDQAEFEKYLKINGRLKDIIIRGGVNINPYDIESVLIKFKGINEISVFGKRDEIFNTEKIIAAIVTNENFNEKNFWNFANTYLPTNLVPQDLIYIQNLPKTFSGKVKKSLLKEISLEDEFSEKKIHSKTNKDISFSKDIELIKPPISVSINDKVYELKRKNKKITTLSLGEAYFNIPYFEFDNLDFPDVYHYSHSRGIIELRILLSNYFKEYYGIKFEPESQIMITAGSKIAVYMTLKSLANKNDQVLIPEPAWVSYSEQVKLTGAKPIGIPIKETVLNWDKYINTKTKIIIINNPNNPTGKIYSLKELSHIYELAKKNNCYILSDEAYSEFCSKKDSFVSIGNLDTKLERSVLINSISKNYGISGWRIGYAISSHKIIDRLVKINQHLITCAPTILTHYISKHFYEIIQETRPQIKKLIEMRYRLQKYMNKIGLIYISGKATFYFFINISKSRKSSTKFCEELLHKHNISTVPGIGYGKSCNKYIRLSFGSESEYKIKKALLKINQMVNDKY